MNIADVLTEMSRSCGIARAYRGLAILVCEPRTGYLLAKGLLFAANRATLEGFKVYMTDNLPEPWLRGSIPDVPGLLQPVAHALIHSLENTADAVRELSYSQFWHAPGGAASVGYHLRHLSGSTDRLITYARGEALSDAQKAQLDAERSNESKPGIEVLLSEWSRVVESVLDQLTTTSEDDLKEIRYVGRARLESTVLGLLFHAAEHASRHTGQIVTTANIIKASSSAD